MRSTSWLIMIFDDICLKTDVKVSFLGVEKSRAPPRKIKVGSVIPAMFPLREHMVGKIEFGGKMPIFTNKLAQFVLF